jgi:branched-chain amino acid transport system permease protein
VIQNLLTPKTLFVTLLILAFLLIPKVVTSTFYIHTLIMIFYFGYLASCWNLMAGYAGQASLGHAVFVGTGAYTSSFLLMRAGLSPWIGMWIGALFSLILGLFIGYLTFRYRLRGHYFLLATIAFAEILKILVLNIRALGGGSGIALILRGNPFGQFIFSQKSTYYYVILAMVVGILLLTRFLLGRRTGYYLKAIRENEDLAQASGIPILKYKLLAIALSAALTSLGGTFYAQYICFIDPPSVLGLGISVDILIPAIVGGIGTLFGPILGAFIVIPIAEVARSYLGGGTGGIHLIIYGLFLIVVILFMRAGLMGLLSKIHLFDSGSEQKELV